MLKSMRMKQLCCSLSALALLTGCAQLLGNRIDAAPKALSDQSDADVVYENRIGRHFYAGTGLGASWLEPDTSEVPGVNVNDRVNAGGQITVGMDLSRQLAMELHSADLGSAGLSPAGRINYHVHGVSALLYAGKQRHNYRRQGLTGYGRVGLGFLDNSPVGDVDYVKDNGAHFLIGAGLEYMTKIGLGLRAEAISYEEDIRYGQLALVYRTGTRRNRKPVDIVKAPTPQPITVPAVKVIEPIPEPVVEAPSVCEEFTGVLEGVNFHSDSDELTNEGAVALDRAADKLGTCSDVQIEISAHTDSVGSASYNQALSQRRAEAVLKRFSDQGISTTRMRATAHGESRPIDTNETADGRRRNRRVEVIAH